MAGGKRVCGAPWRLTQSAVLIFIFVCELWGQSETAPNQSDSVSSASPETESGLIATIRNSIFGKGDVESWRPLPISTFFTEGWNEPWVPSPKGSGGAPRQGWINASAGYIARTQFLSFAQGFNRGPEGDGYLGSYTLLTPLNRRFEIITSVPFVLRNNFDTGLPIINPTRQPVSTLRSHTGFGDISVTPRALLHETQDLSVVAEMAIVTPTGTEPLAGMTATLVPAVSFWNDLAGRVVVRGGIGFSFPTDGSQRESIAEFAVGQTLTDHDVPIVGDFTYYLSAVANTPLSQSQLTRVTLTPGIRTHIGRNWSLLVGLPTPVTKERVADLGLICWFLKSW